MLTLGISIPTTAKDICVITNSMNPANGTTIAGAPTNSFGNAFPMFGTGNVIYTPSWLFIEKRYAR